jgi:hypothetical protein
MSPLPGWADDRLEFPGKCEDKTGADPRKFSSEYKDFLAKSFETQTWVYEQAVRPSTRQFDSSLPDIHGDKKEAEKEGKEN